jgi:hypothetical protein
LGKTEETGCIALLGFDVERMEHDVQQILGFREWDSR